MEYDLDIKKEYFAIKVDKNRIGRRADIILFEIDLDVNKWECIGYCEYTSMCASYGLSEVLFERYHGQGV